MTRLNDRYVEGERNVTKWPESGERLGQKLSIGTKLKRKRIPCRLETRTLTLAPAG